MADRATPTTTYMLTLRSVATQPTAVPVEQRLRLFVEGCVAALWASLH